MEAQWIVRRQGSSIFYKICPLLAVRFLALRAGHALPPVRLLILITRTAGLDFKFRATHLHATDNLIQAKKYKLN
jgi:hypothetical protein